MGRPLRPTSADLVYHMLNRANARRTLFETKGLSFKYFPMRQPLHDRGRTWPFA